MDDREIIEYCGHYLIRGSEYLFSLIQNLKYPIDKYKTYLQSKSKPTIFRLHLPLNLVKDHELWELFDDLLNQWIYRKAHNSPGNKTLNFSLELYEDLNSKYIISHFHPKYIRDPHNGRRILNTTNGKYIQDKLSK